MTVPRIEEWGSAWKIFVIGLVLLGFQLGVRSSSALAAQLSDQGSAPNNAGIRALEVKRLQAEIRNLEEKDGPAWWESIASLAVLLSAAVALGGLLWTISQQRREMSFQRRADRRANRFNQRVRLDGLFASLANEISSEDPSVRVAATAGIRSFKAKKRHEYHDQLLSLLQGTIKLPRNDVSDRVVSRAFVDFLSSLQERGAALDHPLDLERAYLEGCSLKGVNLHAADLRSAQLRDVAIDPSVDLEGLQGQGLIARGLRAPRARLRFAKLTGADLREAKLRGANLQGVALKGATLVAADLREADLVAARLQDARLQSAHFERADLRGARFDGADLRDAYFGGATIDLLALKSARRANSWEAAHWDAHQLDRLRKLNERAPNPG